MGPSPAARNPFTALDIHATLVYIAERKQYAGDLQIAFDWNVASCGLFNRRMFGQVSKY
jgi:hypothetical protein